MKIAPTIAKCRPALPSTSLVPSLVPAHPSTTRDPFMKLWHIANSKQHRDNQWLEHLHTYRRRSRPTRRARSQPTLADRNPLQSPRPKRSRSSFAFTNECCRVRQDGLVRPVTTGSRRRGQVHRREVQDSNTAIRVWTKRASESLNLGRNTAWATESPQKYSGGFPWALLSLVVCRSSVTSLHGFSVRRVLQCPERAQPARGSG